MIVGIIIIIAFNIIIIIIPLVDLDLLLVGTCGVGDVVENGTPKDDAVLEAFGDEPW